jgi:hypothetical protein
MRFYGSERSRAILACAIGIAAVAACVAASPGFASIKSGYYDGKSSQTDQIGDPEHLSLRVNKSKTTVTVIYFELYCPGLPGLQYAGLSGPIKPNGDFKALSPGNGFYGKVRGRFSGKKATGTVTYDNTTGCDIGPDVTWSANHKHG